MAHIQLASKGRTVRAGEAYILKPGHFAQTIEPVELVEFSPRDEHDRTIAAIAKNLGLAV